MEPLASVVDKLKSLAKSGEDFVSGLCRRRENASRRNPIEILKRLQREAFSDLMKIRDRQDKVERMLTFYRTSKGGPFQEDGTRVKGAVNLLGALLLGDDLQLQNSDELGRSGIRTGINSKITFETTVRQRDTLVMEVGASHHTNQEDSALSISKVGYTANVTDWLSLVAIPMGAHCSDLAVQTSSYKEKGLTDYSSYGPPLLKSLNGSAIGLMARKPNVVASLAQFDSALGFGHLFSTFGQIVCQLPKNTKLSLFGLHHVPKLNQHRNSGALTIPLGILKRGQPLDEPMEPSDPSMGASSESHSAGSVALMLESELDEFTRLQGWVQLKNSNPRCVQWSVGLSDSPEDEVGWGVSIGSMFEAPANQDHYQIDAYLKLNLGKKFTLQPGLVYVMDGSNQMPAIMLRSTWSL